MPSTRPRRDALRGDDDMSDIRRISADEAHACMQQGHTFVDVRTEEEFDAGHPAGALNVPFMLSVQGTMLPNADFLSVMTRAFPKDARIVLGCAAGNRSARAATALASVGFSGLLDLRPGWNGARDAFGQVVEKGWLAAGLPTALAACGGSYADVKQRT